MGCFGQCETLDLLRGEEKWRLPTEGWVKEEVREGDMVMFGIISKPFDVFYF